MVKRHYTRWTKEKLVDIALTSISYAECIRKMGLVEAGGNFKQLQRNLDKFNINTDHFLGQAHNKGKELIPYEELIKPTTIKNRILKDRGHICENCGIKDWLGKPLTLELEHVDGDNRNNNKTNLLLLCPNCHSQTPTWRNRKRI